LVWLLAGMVLVGTHKSCPNKRGTFINATGKPTPLA